MGLIQTLQPIWMGVRRNFPGGGAKTPFCLSFFEVVGDATQMDV